MVSLKKNLFLLHLLLFVAFEANATHVAGTHVVGADAQWRSLGGDTFEITLTVYMRCTDGGSSLTNPIIQIISDSCTNSYNFNSGNPVSYAIDDVTPVCMDNLKPCGVAGGSGQSTAQIPLGIERNRLTYKIYLGGPYANCCWYMIRWGLCCRSPNNTTGFMETDFLNEFWLNRCITNNSPHFLNNELVMRCAGEDVCYNLGMYDDDGDSLSYALSMPLGGGNYTAPWSYSYPLTCNGGNNPDPNAYPPKGFNLDPVTGDMIFRPTQLLVTPIKVSVTEWRTINGIPKVIGKTGRDMEITILLPFNKTPTLSVSPVYNFCAEQLNCFEITTGDLNTGDSTIISSNFLNAIPGSSFNVVTDSALHATGTFCWTPTAGQVRTKPYNLLVKVRDNHCPVYSETHRTISIIVKPKFDITVSKVKNSCTTYDLIAFNKDTSSHYRKWEIRNGTTLLDSFIGRDTILNYKFYNTGFYIVNYIATNTNCTFSHTDTIIVTNAESLKIIKTKDTTICAGTSLIIGANPLNGQPPYGYRWYNNNNLVSITQNFSATPLMNTTYKLEAISSDTCKINCIDSVTINIFPTHTLFIIPGSSNLVYGQSTVLRSNGKNNFNWSGNGIISNWGDSVLVKPLVTTTYTLISINANGCDDTAKVTLYVSNVGIGKLRPAASGGNELRVYPNPAMDEIIIFNSNPMIGRFSIVNIWGQVQLEGELKKKKTNVNINSLAPGIYFIKVGNETRKFVKGP